MRIYRERKKFVDHLNDYVSRIYLDIARKGNFCIQYNSDYDNLSVEEILNMYQKSLKKDLSFGKTSLGVHTDDMTFLLDGYEIC